MKLTLDYDGRDSYSLGMKREKAEERAVVSEKGQVTIPKPLRDRLGIKAGQVLAFREERGRLVATKAAGDDPVSGVYGTLVLDRSTDEVITELRGPADAT